MTIDSPPAKPSLRVASLFSGIGGFELGLAEAGHQTIFMCEWDEHARAVLRHRFPGIDIASDITNLDLIPECDLLTAGWPCQDISQAGTTQGLGGGRSGLISEVFRLLAKMTTRPRFVLLENVAFALELRKGEAVRYVTEQLSLLGYRWAYRVLNTRMFGVPQRRRRLFVLGSLEDDPSEVLFGGASTSPPDEIDSPSMVGFYWTEGNRGLGWSPGAIPPLKGGSGIGIPSPPAIWDKRASRFITPGIEDAERLQGFPAGWTSPAAELPRGERKRWTLVGNAVSVPVVSWIGGRLRATHSPGANPAQSSSRVFSKAGSGGPNTDAQFFEPASEGPDQPHLVSLETFGLTAAAPLSPRAIAGFTRRFEVAPLRKDPAFLEDLRRSLAAAAKA